MVNTAFPHSRLPASPDATAPDGTQVRLLGATPRGSMAHFELATGAVSHAVAHKTVEEIWYFVEGRGVMWRAVAGEESVVEVAAGVSLTIPPGARFQFRADAAGPLKFIAVTMPPWPGADEAYRVEGPWAATVET